MKTLLLVGSVLLLNFAAYGDPPSGPKFSREEVVGRAVTKLIEALGDDPLLNEGVLVFDSKYFRKSKKKIGIPLFETAPSGFTLSLTTEGYPREFFPEVQPYGYFPPMPSPFYSNFKSKVIVKWDGQREKLWSAREQIASQRSSFQTYNRTGNSTTRSYSRSYTYTSDSRGGERQRRDTNEGAPLKEAAKAPNAYVFLFSTQKELDHFAERLIEGEPAGLAFEQTTDLVVSLQGWAKPRIGPLAEEVFPFAVVSREEED